MVLLPVTYYMNLGIDGLRKYVLEKGSLFHLKKYEEIYSMYPNIINDKNKESIKRLNELAIKLEDMLKDENPINEDSFRDTCNEMYFLIHGDDHIKI